MGYGNFWIQFIHYYYNTCAFIFNFKHTSSILLVRCRYNPIFFFKNLYLVNEWNSLLKTLIFLF